MRFATEKFDLTNIDQENWQFIHLTNYAINKENHNNQGGFKTLFSDLLLDLKDGGQHTDKMIEGIHDLIIKTILTAQNKLKLNYSFLQPNCLDFDMGFELLGFDILLDCRLKPILLEVNSYPSFAIDGSIDDKVKRSLITDTLKIV